MLTKSFFLSWADLSIGAINRIEAEFPCFTFVYDIDEDTYEAVIKARVEDWPSIENILAPFV